MVDWPSSVPDLCRLDSLRIKPVSGSIPIDTDSGPPVTRRRFTGDLEDLEGVVMAISRTAAITLRDFWRTTLKDGSLTFTARHPVTLEFNSVFVFLSEPKLSRIGHLYNAAISVRKVA